MPLSQSARNSVQFDEERIRLMAALRHMTEGGIVERIDHIGATSMPDAATGQCIDVAVSVWPFPIDAEAAAILQGLGYESVAGQEGSAPSRWMHTSGDLQLSFFEAGSGSWSDYRIISEYLRQDEAARASYLAQKRAWAARWALRSRDYETAKRAYFVDLLDEARRWWIIQQSWTPVESVRDELQDFEHPWYVSGGWALDLYLDHPRRVHEDVDVVFPRAHQLALQEHMAERGWRWVAPTDGRMQPWPAGIYLDSSHHQVHAHREGAFIDFLLTEMDRELWHYRRDRLVIRATERAGLISQAGIPYLAPELVLLFKSKNTSGRERSKDEVDFQEVLPHLEPERRAWLNWALMVTDPNHPWIEQIQPGNEIGP